MFSKTKKKIVLSNTELGYSILTLLKSREGKKILLDSILNLEKSLYKRLLSFIDQLEKEGFFEIITNKEYNKDSLLKKIDGFHRDLTSLTLKDISQVITLILKDFSIEDHITLESIILGIHAFISQHLSFYFEILDFRERIYSKKNASNIIFDLISDKEEDIFLDSEKIKNFFNALNISTDSLKLMTYNSESMLPDQMEEIQISNKKEVLKIMKPFDTIFINNLSEKLELSKKEKQKLIKDIQSKQTIEQLKENDSIDRLNEDIYSVIEVFLFKLSKYKKKILNKDIISSLS